MKFCFIVIYKNLEGPLHSKDTKKSSSMLKNVEKKMQKKKNKKYNK